MASASKTVKKAAMKILQAADAGDLRSLKSKGTRIAQAIASVRHGSRDGRGVLHIAAAKGRTEICQYLIEELGFDSNLVPDNGYAEILELLLSRGGPIEARNIAGTPLILATCKADDSCMKALLDHNADPNQVSDGFFTPLFIAVINDSTKCVEVLLKAGADVNKVPLLELAFDSAKMLDYLLEVGADPNIPNDYGRLPIEIAAVRGKREVVEKLYPLTSPIPIVSDWSIYGLFRHVESPIYQVEEELQSNKRLDRLKRKADSALSRKEYMVSIFLWTYILGFLWFEHQVDVKLNEDYVKSGHIMVLFTGVVPDDRTGLFEAPFIEFDCKTRAGVWIRQTERFRKHYRRQWNKNLMNHTLPAQA